MSKTTDIQVIKIGGNVVDNPEALERFISDFAQIEGRKILIHGGGKLATRLSDKLGIATQMIDGRRVTDAATLEVVTMVYGGAINKHIVAMLQAAGCNAIGLSGADANLLPAVRRNPEPIDYGFVGDIEMEAIPVETLKALLDIGLTPVFCALTHDRHGSMLNSNADSVAQAVAVAASHIDTTHLHYCFEKMGVLRDVEDENSLIELITAESFASLREAGVVNKGMIPKIENALRAIEAGVSSVIIQHSDNILSGKGTTIR